MLKRLTLVMAMVAFLSSSVFAQSYLSSEDAAPTKTKTVKTKTAKKVTAAKKSTPKHHVASKKTKKKSSKVA
ncbi:hypothetical protein FA592_05930 [Sulfurospirillum diekertiae]|uniref:Uncharacterized protein n=1 Tax=Sulfurospirillum diekertiae TaxID=1854492 RepID=A0A6G9VT11_9BACT|nr:hypothetical protein [Sulfurospirillum diekertiae]ASC94670.1 hypothetical protein Sdiek2_2668 [Sulfurospirillum diekertiae]QIR75793.1 hypothetical protein FA584_06030 [Sulfurospirillum diekertiae]QIR78438.1 hypothetical protein FA592_05930 [Sulfurospirillum diekertiae]